MSISTSTTTTTSNITTTTTTDGVHALNIDYIGTGSAAGSAIDIDFNNETGDAGETTSAMYINIDDNAAADADTVYGLRIQMPD